MENLWNQQEASKYQGDLALRVYTSRLLGREPYLVLHGGGNTSVKVQQKNVVGEIEDILYVKGSGWDLATIEEAGFSPVRIPHLLKLAQLPTLSDSQMVNELKTQMVKASAPSPSVETILHAILPFKFVDHTHAAAVVSISNTVERAALIREVYCDQVVVIPYIMPGFDLARLCRERFLAEATDNTVGMVLMNHGIFSFGQTAKISYDRMINLVTQAEEYLKHKQAWNIDYSPPQLSQDISVESLALLRRDVSQVAGFPVVFKVQTEEKILAFTQHPDIEQISQQGPVTPDHVIRTKRLPLLGRDVEAYAEAYNKYFQTCNQKIKESKQILDPAPRVILDQEWGLITVGKTPKAAAIAADIYQQTIDVIQWSTALGGYCALPAQDIFDVEYWELEQAKLKKKSTESPFTGEIALVTGAASGIGKACVKSLLQRGAAVVGIDINPAVKTLYKRQDFCGLTCDIGREDQLKTTLKQTIRTFGGLDILILNAGIFPGGCAIADLSTSDWQKVLSINLDANLVLLRECYPFLKLAPNGGRVVVIGSKNVPAPGPGAAAYSASKAALTQLMRVAALEWGQDGIRLNSVHPNAVFDTGLWTDEVLQARAAHYGLTVNEYKKNNLLKTEVSSHDVAELAVEMSGSLFAKTTAAQVPIDGGNERVV